MHRLQIVILLVVILLIVILLDVVRRSDILLSVKHSSAALASTIRQCITLLTAILLSFIWLRVILPIAIWSNILWLSVILLSVIMPISICLCVVLMSLILTNDPYMRPLSFGCFICSVCHLADYHSAECRGTNHTTLNAWPEIYCNQCVLSQSKPKCKVIKLMTK